MVNNSDGDVVGIVDMFDFNPQHLRAEVGIVTLNEHRRQGYALAALLQITDYALHVLHLHQLYAVVNLDNEASRCLFKKAGFIEAAQLKDWLYDGKNYHPAVLMQIFF